MDKLEYKEINEIIRHKDEILSDLKSKDREKRKTAWDKIKSLVDTGNVEVLEGEKNYLRSLLWNRIQGVREDAWSHLDIYKELSVEGIERGLRANSDRIKWTAWSHIFELMDMGIVTRKKVIEDKYSFWRLLRSRWSTIRKKAWRLFVDLVKAKIFDRRDVGRYVEFLRHNKPSVRIYAWEIALQLLNLGFIDANTLKSNQMYLEDLTKIESRIKKRALRILLRLKS
ncbi:hypothetical protein SUSAZ_07825 [Sulfolobus acidocaldarius SUSAZ]|nr:hypothetical protein SUSAZ_07825 [Sulfolobus acidocaldarius SUSAZ]